MPTRKRRMRIKRSQKRKTKGVKRTKRVKSKSKRRMRGGAGSGAGGGAEAGGGVADPEAIYQEIKATHQGNPIFTGDIIELMKMHHPPHRLPAPLGEPAPPNNAREIIAKYRSGGTLNENELLKLRVEFEPRLTYPREPERDRLIKAWYKSCEVRKCEPPQNAPRMLRRNRRFRNSRVEGRDPDEGLDDPVDYSEEIMESIMEKVANGAHGDYRLTIEEQYILTLALRIPFDPNPPEYNPPSGRGDPVPLLNDEIGVELVDAAAAGGGAGGGAALPTATETREAVAAAAERRQQLQRLLEFSQENPARFKDQTHELKRLEYLDPDASFLDLVKTRRVDREAKEIVDSMLKDVNFLRQKLLVNGKELAGLYHMTFCGPGRPPIPALPENFEEILRETVYEKFNHSQPKFQVLKVFSDSLITFWTRSGFSEVQKVEEFLDHVHECATTHPPPTHPMIQGAGPAAGWHGPPAWQDWNFPFNHFAWVTSDFTNDTLVDQIRSSMRGGVIMTNRMIGGNNIIWVWGDKIKNENNGGDRKVIVNGELVISAEETDRTRPTFVHEHEQAIIRCGEIIAKGFRDLSVERKIREGLIGVPLIIQHEVGNAILSIVRYVNADDETPYFI